MSSKMVTLPNPDYLKEMLETGKANGRDTGLDPRIAKMVEFLDRAIYSRNETVGVVTAAVGIILGRKGMDPDNLERLIYDVTTAVRVGFYLHCINKGK
jgi:hypothetical protein